VIFNNSEGKEVLSVDFRQQIVPKTWCSDGLRSVRELEMSSDWGRERLRDIGQSSMAGW